MKTKALFLNGSARGDRGVTSRLINSLSTGMARADVETVLINISKLNISPCIACLHCMHKEPGVCLQKDDMSEIYKHLKNSDILVFGSPIYLDGITSQLKTVIDRSVCCMEPFLTRDGNGFTRHTFSWEMPSEFFLVSTSGFPEPETFRPTIDYFKALSRNMNSNLIAEFCIPGSIAIQMKADALDQKLELLELAGFEYGKNRCIDSELLEKINKPIFSRDEYLNFAKIYEDYCRKRLFL